MSAPASDKKSRLGALLLRLFRSRWCLLLPLICWALVLGLLNYHQTQVLEKAEQQMARQLDVPMEALTPLTQQLQQDKRQIHLWAFLLLNLISLLAITAVQHLFRHLQQERSQRESIIAARTASLQAEINRNRTSQERLSFLAHHDELTGAANRRNILQQFSQLMAGLPQSDRPLAALMLDIDHFKRVNDTYGHEAGDEVLKGFVRTLQRELRRHDLLGRYGGEEFLVLLPETAADEAWRIAERLRQAVEQADYACDSHKLKITTSLGIALANRDTGISKEELISRADAALYQAKREGRNRSVLWQSPV